MKVFTTAEVAKMFGVSHGTITGWVFGGYLVPSHRGSTGTGNGHRFTAAAIKAMIRKDLREAKERARVRYAALYAACAEEVAP